MDFQVKLKDGSDLNIKADRAKLEGDMLLFQTVGGEIRGGVPRADVAWFGSYPFVSQTVDSGQGGKSSGASYPPPKEQSYSGS